MNIQERIAVKLFSSDLPTLQSIEERYPQRVLPADAMVTRVAPSPTGFMHLGGLYAALISERLAHQSGGVFYIRIEDTDKKREVAGAAGTIVRKLRNYDLVIDEGPLPSGDEVGAYGPYTQSKRADLYHAHIRELYVQGRAYPCFCTVEELDEMRKLQELQRARFGYYGQWAKCRDRSEEKVLELLQSNTPYVMRFKSMGDFNKKITVADLLKGRRELSENDQDIVIMKSDGLPTYHFAHLIDDHYMRTTHIVRGDEWFSSLPLHLQLFELFGWTPPRYGHYAAIQKMDGTSKRKLSKRYDAEANVEYYTEVGYPRVAVLEYLLNLADSEFEEWRAAHQDTSYTEYVLRFERLASSAGGALFDLVKLESISKDVIANMRAQDVYECAVEWAREQSTAFARVLEDQSDYAIQSLSVERALDGKGRKDIAKWSDVPKEISYFFEPFTLTQDQIQLLKGISQDVLHGSIELFIKTYEDTDSKERWFEKVKEIAKTYGYAESQKELKTHQEQYKGYVADIVKIFRVLLTGRAQSPDLHAIMKVMGNERVFRRLKTGLDLL
ncbi:glutamate--tRNA ligase [Candidatus Uhrbacteria bacterium]|nr:glutamate--tRNA ligase [Candidatus Uhrbacteria bacterium]